MAVLYVTEFNGQGLDNNGRSIPVAEQPPTAEQHVSIGGSSTASSAFNNNTRLIRLHTDAICSIEIGASPTATTTTARMAANQTEYFTVPGSSGYAVAVISNT